MDGWSELAARMLLHARAQHSLLFLRLLIYAILNRGAVSGQSNQSLLIIKKITQAYIRRHGLKIARCSRAQFFPSDLMRYNVQPVVL